MAEIVKVDALGDTCPIPVVKTKKALDGLGGAAIVETHVDNEIAVQNVSKMAKQQGYEVSSEKVEEGHYVIKIKTEEGLLESADADVSSKGDFVVAVEADRMGRGNDELGKVLIKGFLYAVSQLEKLPSAILFYNGGAVLTTEGSDSLEDLRYMAEQGVAIKTCGTCLNYYNLSDKLAVGEVTNMYDIVETLAKAGKVIKP